MRGATAAKAWNERGERVRPGRGIRSPEVVADIRVAVPAIHVAIADLLVEVNRILDATRAKLQLPSVATVGVQTYHRQSDLDASSDSAARLILLFVEKAWRICKSVQRASREDKAARAMLGEFRRLIRATDTKADSGVVLWFASRWQICTYKLTSDRMEYTARVMAVAEWKAAVEEGVKLMVAATAKVSVCG